MTSGFLVDRWFDGERLRHEPITLRVASGLITALEPRRPDRPDQPGDPDLVDARAHLVLPGLVNTHAHVARAGFFEAEEPPLQLQQIVGNFLGALRAGVTTVADMGCTMPMLRALRALTDANPLAGPRFVGAGPMLTAPEGYPFNWVSPLWRHSEAVFAVDSERDAARAVGRTIDGGMDHLKVAIMHESFARQPLPALRLPAARAIVAEAHRLGRRVYAHAHSLEDYRVALDAGVDALMHSCFEPLSADDVQRIVDAGVAVCPTLWAYDSTCLVGDCGVHLRADLQRHASRPLRRSWQRFADAYAASGEVFPEDSTIPGVGKEAARQAMRIGAANLRLLADAGVPVAFGNDASFGVSLLARPYDELAAMHAAGLDVIDCLRAATGNAGGLLGRPDLGRIAVGASADLLLASPQLAHDLTRLDVDRGDVELRVYARGLAVPATSRTSDALAIARAYTVGTGRTLGRTLVNWGRARLARSTAR